MNWSEIWKSIVDFCSQYALRILGAIIVLVVGNILIKVFMKRFLKGKFSKKLDSTAVSATRTLIKVILQVLLIVTVVMIIGVPMASVITVLASVGAAIALALQGALGNFASGIILLITRPFKVGDWIIVGDYSGKVIDFGIFYTTIEDIENLEIYIPNSDLTNTKITNCTINPTRRTNLVVSAAYGTDPDKVRNVILQYAMNNENILKDPAPFCEMSKMNSSSIDFAVRFWIKNEIYWDTYFNIQKDIYNEFYKNGISIPFDQVDVHIINDEKQQ